MENNIMIKLIILSVTSIFMLSFNASGTEKNKLTKVSFNQSSIKQFKNFNSNPNIQKVVMCFFKGERTSGMNKICYYDCLGSEAAITISSISLCPLSINN